jgi:hypothetical protein
VADELPALPASVEVAAYRIVVEAVTNIARHSGATEGSVRLMIEGDMLRIEVLDRRRRHRRPRDRRRHPRDVRTGAEVGGELAIEGRPGGGTRLVALSRCPRRASRVTAEQRDPDLPMTGIRVVVADDHPVYRDGLRSLVDRSPDLELVGEAATGVEAVAAGRTRGAERRGDGSSGCPRCRGSRRPGASSSYAPTPGSWCSRCRRTTTRSSPPCGPALADISPRTRTVPTWCTPSGRSLRAS